MLSIASISVILLCFSNNGFAQDSTTPSGVFVDNVCICVTTGYCNLAGGSGQEHKNFFTHFRFSDVMIF